MTDIEEKKRRAADPTTPGDELARLASSAPATIATIARKNPSLPTEDLLRWLAQGYADAWTNISVPLVLLLYPGDDTIRKGAMSCASGMFGMDLPSNVVHVLDNAWQEAADAKTLAIFLDHFSDVGPQDGEGHRRSVAILLRVAKFMGEKAGIWSGMVRSYISTLERWTSGELVNVSELPRQVSAERRRLRDRYFAQRDPSMEWAEAWAEGVEMLARAAHHPRSRALPSAALSLERAEAQLHQETPRNLADVIRGAEPRFPFVGLDKKP